ncbi:hypothetical protein I2I11_14235 [Pontibacter sp. 172403-2]|uniref:hypothetical protein n=1 Tax=Pontibacter rufus TaxID=2791028 RepID=UPI0018B015F8|nr:hypothetical protein [Pontibacter sp. 172403-2]MBF9254459.1 hypothetical protein [Pontibacter sp. 172403-2]
MKIYTQLYNDVSLTIAEGITNKKAFSSIKDALDGVPEHSRKLLWLDCSGLQQIIHSNTSFSCFINELLALRAQQVQILLFGLDNTTCRLLKLLKLDSLFQQARTLDEAYMLLHRNLVAA